jgi:hypothetical protein
MKISMSNVYIRSTINGKVIEIEQLNVGHILSMIGMDISTNAKLMIAILSKVTIIDGKRVSVDDIMNMTDLDVYTFMINTITVMTDNTNVFKDMFKI